MYAIIQTSQSNGLKTIFVDTPDKYKDLIPFLPYTLIGITDNIVWKKQKLNSTYSSMQRMLTPSDFFTFNDANKQISWQINDPRNVWDYGKKEYVTQDYVRTAFPADRAFKLSEDSYNLCCDLFGWIDEHEIVEKRKRVDWRDKAKRHNLKYWDIFKTSDYLSLINISEIIT